MVACAACGTKSREGARYCDGCGALLVARPERREQRKTVTVLFCDMTGSTALGERLDPEPLRMLLNRYFERMRAIVERHGGAVDKFIGDAVVAVFGVPVVREDDAVRAVRAAVEMRAALPELGVEARFGINSGEVMTAADDRLTTGDSVNVAARLQQAAEPGEILLGAQTVALSRGAVDVERLEALVLKGKSEPVVAYRLLSIGETPDREHGGRFVGRRKELVFLQDRWATVVATGRCELVTLVGEPGVGKSRLVAELAAGLDARVVQGRCLSYGEGITYSPVVEVIKQLNTPPDDPAAAVTIGSLLGEGDAATSPEEIAWAVRKLLEGSAPLLVVFDDVQWAEGTFLDLIEHVALRSAGAPLLLLCIARPELSESRPEWPITLKIEPLPLNDVEELLPRTITPELRERIAHAAGGNPLFVTEMVAFATDARDEVVVPPTLKALLAARLDQLETGDRAVLERGAVEGELFHRGAVQALSPADEQVAPRLAALVRRELIRPDRPLLQAQEGFRFRHILIRDAAYDAVPKATRAELHERLAGWLERYPADLVERDELAGYHLEQAHRYQTELGHSHDQTGAVGQRAAAHLAAAALRAASRGDNHAAANLLERVLALGVANPTERLRVQVQLERALYQTGQFSAADEVLAAALEVATDLCESGIAAHLRVAGARHRFNRYPGIDFDEITSVAESAIDTLTELGDSAGLALAERLLGMTLGSGWGRFAEGSAALERALVHAEASGDPATRREVVSSLCTNLVNGPMPAGEAIHRLEELLRTGGGDRVLEATIGRALSMMLAMDGRFAEALELVRESSHVLDELNQTTARVFQQQAAATREICGDRPGAEHELTAQLRFFRGNLGDAINNNALNAACRLALFYCDERRWIEAEGLLAYGRDVPLEGARELTIRRLLLDARLAAHRGELTEAVEGAQRAIELAEGMDYLNLRALLWLALAEVQTANGRSAEAGNAVTAALELYEQKGNVAAAAQVRAAAL